MDGGNNNNTSRAVLEAILCRLSVKDLLKFRSVCRAWKTIIDREDFKKKHFETAKQINTKAPTILILKRVSVDLNEFELETNLHYCCPKYWSSILIVNNRQQPFNLAQFLDLKLKRFGAVNGLVCFGWDDIAYVIGNPTTTQYKTFKGPPALFQISHRPCFNKADMIRTHDDNVVVNAFGFDPVSQDYKFFYGYFIPLLHNSIPNRTQVAYCLYSLRNDSWSIGDTTYLSNTVTGIVNGDGYTDDGKFYWFVKHCGPTGPTCTPVFISFDFCTEVIGFVNLPRAFYGVHQAIAVGNCRDVDLLMTFKHGCHVGNLRCEVWRMQRNESDGSLSWNITCRVQISLQIGRPIGLIKGSGDMMFEASIVGDDNNNNNKELLLINPRTQSRINLGFTAPEILVFNFVNTLFSPVN